MNEISEVGRVRVLYIIGLENPSHNAWLRNGNMVLLDPNRTLSWSEPDPRWNQEDASRG